MLRDHINSQISKLTHSLLPLRELRELLMTAFNSRSVCIVRYGQKAHLSNQLRQNLEKLSRKFQVTIAVAAEANLNGSFLAISSANQNLSNCFSILYSVKAVNLELKQPASGNLVSNTHRYLC